MSTPESASPVAVVNHVGLTTPDIFATIDWYAAVFGFALIMGPRVLEGGEAQAIFGPRFRTAYQAHLLSSNGLGIELFQFVDPPVEPAEPAMPYTRRGWFHLSVTVPDVPAAVGRVVAAGGTTINDPTAFVPGRPWLLSYCRDPWGTALELVSATYAEMFANWPQPGARDATRLLNRDGTEHVVPPR